MTYFGRRPDVMYKPIYDKDRDGIVDKVGDPDVMYKSTYDKDKDGIIRPPVIDAVGQETLRQMFDAILPTPKLDFPGTARYETATAATGGKVYVGLGYDGSNNYADWYEYDPATDTWTQKTDFPGAARRLAVAVYLTKVYVGLGLTSAAQRDWYEYDPTTDTWTRRADLPTAARYGAASAAGNDKVYVGLGYDGANYHTDWWLLAQELI